MKNTVLIVSSVLILAAACPAPAAVPGSWSDAVPKVSGAHQYFVATNGTAAASGSKDGPWDIASALGGKHPVKPGDIIWIRGGTYQNPDRNHNSRGWAVNLSGTEKAPVHVRAWPGERATLDGGLELGFKGKPSHVWIWDLELMVSDLSRSSPVGGSHPEGMSGPLGGLHTATCTGTKFIDLAIHDTAQGVSWWEGTLDSELHGCLIYNNGWKAPDRNHGHCVYTQNKTGHKTIAGCIMSTPYGHGQQIIQAYGSKKAVVNGFRIENNIFYSMSPKGDRVLVGGQAPGNEDNSVVSNCLYHAGIQLGYSGKNNTGGRVTDNILFRGGISILNYLDAVVRDNLIVGGGTSKPGCGPDVAIEHNDVFSGDKHPGKARAVLIPNKYDPARAVLALFNWTRTSEITLPASPFLKPGESFRLLDPEDFYGKPVFTGRCTGGTIAVPVKGEFAAYVVLKGDGSKGSAIP